ncbi:MAG: hypothetical protein KIT00_03845, partial [Rhodospirillales bacterium]|nr:hypothetical protein [Rhodospirillales bacterium]
NNALRVALDFGDHPDPKRWARFGEIGCWWFRWDNSDAEADAGVTALWSGRRGQKAELLQMSGDGTVSVVESGHVKVVSHSLAATRNRVFETVAEWPARALYQHDRGVGWTTSRAPDSPSVPLPRWRHQLLPMVLLRNVLVRILREGLEEHWTIGILDGEAGEIAFSFDARQVRWLPELAGGYLADPFAIDADGETVIFAEGYLFDDRHGFIVALHRHENGDVSAAEEVLRLPCHGSYPQVFRHDDGIYLLPEAAGSGCVRLYRAVTFPNKWEPDRVLIEDFAGADPTVFRHQGRWWLLAGDHNDQDETKLFAFFSDDLFGPWQPHPLNPVKADLGSSRPAGAPFLHEGRLLRPAQVGTETYGGAVAVNHVIHLSPEAFVEETIAILRPDPYSPYPAGLHTLNRCGSVVVIDGKRHAWSWRCLLHNIARLAADMRA